MKRFKNILYFADGEQNLGSTFERALILAHSNQARLCVFDVTAETKVPAGIEERLGLSINSALREVRYETLLSLVESRLAPGERPQVQIASGVGFIEVIRAVIRDGYDLVIKASQPPGGLPERILGSTDMHLLRKCPCPVWIDHPSQPPTYSNILAAVDPEEPDGHDCAVKVLELAATIAEREHARLTIIHAWHMYEESALETGFSQVPKEELEELLLQAECLHQVMFDNLIDECGLSGAGHRAVMLKGPPAETIRMEAQQRNIDLIVMGTVGRCGIPGFIIGNTAETVLQTTNASILAVKPAAFISPVTL